LTLACTLNWQRASFQLPRKFCEALDTLERRQRSLQQLQAMVREANENIASGRVGPFNNEATGAAVDARMSNQFRMNRA
jgi:hypothetical protein